MLGPNGGELALSRLLGAVRCGLVLRSQCGDLEVLSLLDPSRLGESLVVRPGQGSPMFGLDRGHVALPSVLLPLLLGWFRAQLLSGLTPRG